MAKALLGYATANDPRAAHRLSAENRFLRQRVVDLEDLVVRLQTENDALGEMVAEAPEDVLELA